MHIKCHADTDGICTKNNMIKICKPVYEIYIVQKALFDLNLAVLSPTVTLKIRSGSPKPNQLLIVSCYIHANLVKIHQPVHEMSCTQDSATPTTLHKKQCPFPPRWGDISKNIQKMDLKWVHKSNDSLHHYWLLTKIHGCKLVNF